MSRGLRGFVNRTLSDAIREATGLLTWRDVTSEQVYFVTCEGMHLRERDYSSQIQPSTWSKKKSAQLRRVLRKLRGLIEQQFRFLRIVLIRGDGRFEDLDNADVQAFFDDAKEATRKLNRIFAGTGVEVIAQVENVKLLMDGRLSPDIHLLIAVHHEITGDVEELRESIAAALVGLSLGGVRVAPPPQRCIQLLRSIDEVEAHMSYLHEYPIKIYACDKGGTKVTFERAIRAEWNGVLQNPTGIDPTAIVRAALCFLNPPPIDFYDYALGVGATCFHLRQSVRMLGPLSGRCDREDRNNNGPDCDGRACDPGPTGPDCCEFSGTQISGSDSTEIAERFRSGRKPRILHEKVYPHPDFPALSVTLAIVQHPPTDLAGLCRALPLLGRRLVFERVALDCLQRGGPLTLALELAAQARARWIREGSAFK